MIFAKGYLENISCVRASKEMPYLSDREIEQRAREYGFVDEDDAAGKMKDAKVGEKESELAGNQNAMMA